MCLYSFSVSSQDQTAAIHVVSAQSRYKRDMILEDVATNLEYLHVVQDVSFFMWELLDRINVCIILSSLLDLFFAGFQVVESDHVTVRNITLNAQYCLGFCKIKCFTKRA